MKDFERKCISIVLAIIMIMAFVPFFGTDIFLPSAEAAVEGYYTYSVFDGTASITNVDKSIKGKVIIPSTLGGYPVVKTGNFEGCKNITEITIPKSVTEISSESFYDCTSLSKINIPDSVTYIGREAFFSCISLMEISVPRSVIRIGQGAFRECEKLENITISDSVKYIDMGVFTGTAYANNESNWKDGLLYIGRHLIAAKKELSGAVNIQSGTKTIAASTFNHCINVDKIYIPDSVISIGEYAFGGCKNLTEITVPGSVEYIPGYAFYYCSSLKEIIIPDGIKGIDSMAFDGCESLSEISIADSVTEINADFEDTAYYKNKSNWQNGILYIGNHLLAAQKELYGSVTIREGIKNIADGAFFKCTKITDIIIPDSVIEIGDVAFVDCSNIREIVLPDSVERIRGNAFLRCSSLECIRILNPDAVIDFEEIPETTVIYGYIGSTAEVYARENGVEFMSMPQIAITNTEDICSVNEKCVATLSGITVENLLGNIEATVTVTCENGKEAKLTDTVKSGMRLTLKDNAGKIINTKIVIVPGDNDSDGEITAADARIALRTSVGLDNLNYWQTAAANVDSFNENTITSADARCILRASVGLDNPKDWIKALN